MRRVASYGGPAGVPASQRLKHKLSLTPGLHLISSNVPEERGFLAPVEEPLQYERVLHKTSWATRNFVATVSALKETTRRGSHAQRKDPFAPVVQRPFEAKENENGPSFSDVSQYRGKDVTGEDSAAGVGSEWSHVKVDTPEFSSFSIPSSNTDVAEATGKDNDNSATTSSGDVANITSSVVFESGESNLSPDLNLPQPEIVSTLQEIPRPSSDDPSSQPSVEGDVQVQDDIQGTEVSECEETVPLGLSVDFYHQEQQELCDLGKPVRVIVVGDIQAQCSGIEPVVTTVEEAFVSSLLPHTGQGNSAHQACPSPQCTGDTRIFEAGNYESETMDNGEVVTMDKLYLPGNGASFGNSEEDLSSVQCRSTAALTIQNSCRGWLQRRYFRNVRERVIILQSLVRRNRVWVQYQRTLKAAIVLQRNWRAFQSRRLVICLKIDQAVKERQKIENAAIALQKNWRAFRSRHLLSHLKIEQAVEERQRIENAATVLQKNWRAFRSRRLVVYLKAEQAVKEQRRIENAAIVLQKGWRAFQDRHHVEHLKMEQGRVNNAATVIQKHWRGLQSRYLVERALAERRRIDAVIIFQKLWRGLQSRCLVRHLQTEQILREQQRIDGAVVIQKHWRGLQSRSLVKRLKMEEVLKEQRIIDAAVVVQKHWRSLQARCLLRHLSIEQVVNEHVECTEIFDRLLASSEISGVSMDVAESGDDCRIANTMKVCKSGEDYQVANMIDVGKSDGDYRVANMMDVGKPDEDHRVADMMDVGKPYEDCQVVNMMSVGEDWQVASMMNAGKSDEDCQVASMISVRKSDEDFQVANRSVGKLDEDCRVADMVNAGKSGEDCQVADLVGFDRSDENCLLANMIDVDLSEVQFCKANLSTHEEPQPSVSFTAVDFHSTRGPRTDPLAHQVVEQESLAQAKGHQSDILKQNEKRLQQFAQLFLLQRHIAIQQQHAQAAPPFPPPICSYSGSPSLLATQSLDPETGALYFNGGKRLVALQNSLADAPPTCLVGVRPMGHKSVCEAVNSSNQRALIQQPQGGGKCSTSTKQVVQKPGMDVVLDMVLLLRRIKEENGTSEIDFEGESSTCFSSVCSDIEEGIPLLDRDPGQMRKQNSMARFASSMNMKHLGIPDVNTVLLVLIAMVVYTKTICQGVLFGTRQSQRKS